MVKVSLIMWDRGLDVTLRTGEIFPVPERLICQWEITETELKCSNPEFQWMITEKSDFPRLIGFWVELSRIWHDFNPTALSATAKQFGDTIVINCNFRSTNSVKIFNKNPGFHYDKCTPYYEKTHNIKAVFNKNTNDISNLISAIHSRILPLIRNNAFSMGSKRFTLVIQGDLYEIEKYFLQKQTGNLFAKPKCLTKENHSINIVPVLKQDKTIFS